jgi:hypothetical protein
VTVGRLGERIEALSIHGSVFAPSLGVASKVESRLLLTIEHSRKKKSGRRLLYACAEVLVQASN